MSSSKHFSHRNTRFDLQFSKVNNCFLFTRTDGGMATETTLLPDLDKAEANRFYADRVEFYRAVAVH